MRVESTYEQIVNGCKQASYKENANAADPGKKNKYGCGT